MMKLPCAVVRDLLPLYAEKMTENETNMLVKEHLESCAACREKLEKLERKDTETPDMHTASAGTLLKLKKEIRHRRYLAAAVAALCVFVAVFSFFCHENSLELVPWQPGLIEVEGTAARSTGEANEVTEKTEDVLVLRVNGVIQGTETSGSDEDGSRTVILQGWKYRHSGSSLTKDYNELVLSPVPDRVLYSWGEEQEMLWGDEMNGGVVILPRLVLAYYVLAASALALVSGLVWFLLRKRETGWIPRQVFFAPLSYVAAHLLVMGTRTRSFFMTRDFVCIVLMTAACYALFTLAWQIWLQYRKTA